MYPLSEKPEIQCPACDTKIPKGADECPRCGLDREIIDIGKNDSDPNNASGKSTDESPEKKTKSDSLDDDILEPDNSKDDSLDDFFEELEEELGMEDEEAEAGEVIEREKVIFECPVCGENVSEDDRRCPSCGAIFESEEEKDEEKRFQELMKDADLKLSELIGNLIPTDHFEDLIDQAQRLADSSKFSKAIDKVENALEFGEKLEDLNEDIERLEENIEDWKDKDMNYKSLKEKKKEALDEIRSGKAESAFSILEEALRKVERMEKSERADIKKRINRSVQDLSEILEVAKSFDLTLSDIRNIIYTSLDLSREGNIEKALEELENARERSNDILTSEIEERISELEKRVDSIFDEKRKEKFKDHLEKTRQAKDEKRFKDSHEFIVKAEEISQKSDIDIGDMSVNEILKMKKISEDIGLECEEAAEFIQNAKEGHREGDDRKLRKNFKKAKETLLKKIPKEVQNIMKEGMEELEEAKEKGNDISKPVSHLKKANLLIKEKEFVEALEEVDKFTDSMAELGEDQDVRATVKKTKRKVKDQEENVEVEKKPVEEKESIPEETQREEEKKEEKSEPVSEEGPTEEEKEEIGLELDVDDIYEGSTNLLKVDDLSKSYLLFKKLVKKSGIGVCVSREYPDKAKKKYELEDLFASQDDTSDDEDITDLSMIWLSNMDDKDAVKPKDLEKLSLKLESYVAKEGSIILFNGVEFLTTNNAFKTVLHLIQSLKDQVAVGGSILLIPVSPDALEPSQMEQLEREVDETFS